jgi:hypothetical protein
MQTLLRHTDPLKLRPRPVVSASSLKLGGASHSSIGEACSVEFGSRCEQQPTIAVHLALTVNGENVQAAGALVWAKLGPGAFGWNLMRVLGITKREIILPACLCCADSLVRTKIGRSTFAPELISSGLEAVVTLVALTSPCGGTGLDSCERG